MIVTVNTVFIDMPTTIKAYTITNNDDTYTIVLNSKLTKEQHLLSYHHEMKHIENGDYDKKSSVDIIEVNAHNIKEDTHGII